MITLSASGLWRVEQCPASAVLPHSKRKKYRDAERGSAEHAALEAAAPEGSIPEVAFTWNVLTGKAREVGRSIGREYGKLEEGEIPGTTDLLGVEPKRVRITDYKTGHGYMVAPPMTNIQLGHNALCGAEVYGKEAAHVEVVYTRTGEVKEADYDAFDLAAVRVRLRTIYDRALQAEAMKDDADKLIDAGLLTICDGCWRCDAAKNCILKGSKR